MNKVLVISGQTATGKTDLGVILAKEFNGEIVSFDSRQVYKKLDIITGKDFDNQVSPQSKIIDNKLFIIYSIDSIPVWLYDIYDPKETVNAFDYIQLANIAINDILKRGKLPIIVGGTMFYIKSLIEGVDHIGIGQDWELRNELEEKSIQYLQEKLKKVDRKRIDEMNNSDVNNKRRLIRAIEVAMIKEKKTEQEQKLPTYNFLHIGLIANNEIIKSRIEKRVQKRLVQGALEEVETLLNENYSFEDPGLNTNGYKQLKEYFLKISSKEVAIENWTRGEIDHARRQQVFLRKMEKVHVIEPNLIQGEGIDSNLIEKVKTLVYKWK